MTSTLLLNLDNQGRAISQ